MVQFQSLNHYLTLNSTTFATLNNHPPSLYDNLFNFPPPYTPKPPKIAQSTYLDEFKIKSNDLNILSIVFEKYYHTVWLDLGTMLSHNNFLTDLISTLISIFRDIIC